MAKKHEKIDRARLAAVVDEIVSRMAVIERFSKVADHLDGVAELETDRFGMAVVTHDGHVMKGGDAEEPFPIQSISKMFALTLALRARGDDVWERVGREPSGDPFNSMVDLERLKGIPRNPFINTGALVICDMLLSIDKTSGVPSTVKALIAEKLGNEKFGEVRSIIADDGKESGFSNRAIAYMLKGYGNLEHDVEKVMKLYVEQCAVELTCAQLAKASHYLVHDGVDGSQEDAREQAMLARRVNSLMITCGQYDGSGDFAFRVGMPAKSGVAGAITAIAPDKASIAVWSPTLDENGNSLLGTLALEILSEKMGWSIFG
ncbi:MAG: glutaminase [Rhizobiaceae bacterium]